MSVLPTLRTAHAHVLRRNTKPAPTHSNRRTHRLTCPRTRPTLRQGLNVGEKLHFQLEVSRLNLFHYPPLPPSLKSALFQRELEQQLAHLPLVEDGVEMSDHTVYR